MAINMYLIFIKLIVLLSLFKSVYLNTCIKNRFCSDCITDASPCVWCSSKLYNGQRCRSASDNTSWCPDEIYSPQGKAIVDKNLEFSSEKGKIIQIKPQKYNLKLRPGEAVPFTFSFNAASNYPVDMYFLLDTSKTMNDVKKETAVASEEIYKTLTEVTSDARLGFGTFIDKNAMPINRYDHKGVYSFRHRLNLTSEFEMFKNIVNETETASNRDPPEGGFDALAQIMACDCIGWKKESRKIIVFMTDGPYHVAGDGKYAGIFQPYDGQCYTNKDGVYENELTMDYPSISMINKLAVQNDITIVLAALYDVSNVYQKLQKYLQTSIFTMVTKNGDSMAQVIRDIYEKITKDVQLDINVRSGEMKNFNIKFEPDCTETYASETNACKIQIGKQLEFKGTIELLEYDGTNKQSIDISVKGLNEKLNLDIEVINECNCEKNSEEASAECNGDRLDCGVCRCSGHRYGEKCGCTSSSRTDISTNNNCIPANSSAAECNGHGNCICGSCNCFTGFEGRYCECNTKNCPIGLNGELCSGNEQGECGCETCSCKPGWTGEACDCSTAKENCVVGDEICNNLGECKCNRCYCNDIAKWDQRSEQTTKCVLKTTPSSHEMQCDYLNHCALCQLKENDNCECEGIEVNIVDAIDKTELNNTNWMVCKNFRVRTGCYTDYVYKYDDRKYQLILKLQKEINCAESYYILGFVALLILLLLGIGTIVGWKLLNDYRDRKEYDRFVSEHKHEIDTCINPCYQSPYTTFRNPAYGRSVKQ